jgi:putative transposase
MSNPFRRFNGSPAIIRLAVMMYIRYPLSLRQVEDLLAERGLDLCRETVRFWRDRFGPMFAAEIRKRRVRNRSFCRWRWHLDEVFVKINGETRYPWRAVDHEGEVLEVLATKRRDRKAALRFPKKAMKRYGRPKTIVTDRLGSHRSAMKSIGNASCREQHCWRDNRAENSHQPFRRRERAMAKFRSFQALQKFAAAHASIHNHLSATPPTTRAEFKRHRTFAMAERRRLAA